MFVVFVVSGFFFFVFFFFWGGGGGRGYKTLSVYLLPPVCFEQSKREKAID